MKYIFLMTVLFSSLVFGQDIKNSWLKEPMPGLNMSAAYMTIVNNTPKDLILERVTGPDAKFYEIHSHSNVDGVMKMRQLKNLTIKVGTSHTLKPLSDHIMLLKMPKGPFKKKKSYLTLHFLGLKPLNVELPVLKKVK